MVIGRSRGSKYHVDGGTDWWAEHYPDGQMQRPTGLLCDGCHSTNYDYVPVHPAVGRSLTSSRKE